MSVRIASLVAISLLLVASIVTAQKGDDGFRTRLVNAALERLNHEVKYSGKYYALDYPNGDVPDSIGVCTDLVIRAYRALDIDLQQLVNEDMAENFGRYPRIWKLRRPDPNIDHRRVPNLEVFFRRHGQALPKSYNAEDYLPGDLVTWRLTGNLPHIGIVVDQRSENGQRPLIVHNIGAGPAVDDILFNFEFKIAGHFRYPGSP